MAGVAPAVSPGPVPVVLSVRRQWLAAFIFAFSNFMVVLDLTIANVSIPHIAGNLGITMEQGTWIITSYAVAEAICVPLTGWLAMRFGTTPVFIVSMAGFGLFSLLCGLAPTLGFLVAARIGQGLFGAPLMPMTQTLLMIVIAPQRRGMILGLWAMTTMLGPAVGPIVGGWISDNWSWHWIFLINVPIAIMLVIAGTALLRPVQTVTQRRPIDAVGLGLLIFWIGCLQLVLDTGREHDWFADPTIVALTVATVIGFAVFIIWELTEEHPIVDLRVFRHRGFTFALLSLTFGFGALFSGTVVIPQWLQMTMGYSAQDAGLVSAAQAAGSVLTAALAARLASKVDARLLVFLGLTWVSGVMLLYRIDWTTQQTMFHYALPLFLMGVGMTFFFIPLTQLVLATVDYDEMASAAGLQAFTRTIAVAISTSVVLTIWSNEQRVAHTDLANVLQPDDTVDTLGRIGVGLDGARVYINALVEQQAATVALNYASLVAAILVFIAGVAVWLSPRPDMKLMHGDMAAGGH